MKKIIIYEPMPDILRAEHICAIACDEMEKGHQVLLVLEEEVQLLYRNSFNRPHSIYCKSVIKAKIADSGIPFFALPQNKQLKKRFQSAPKDTLKEIQDYRVENFKKILIDYGPDLIILWNGLVHYQQDFISLSKCLNPDQEYSFIEAGWFPQKGTYYRDPHGVNARSSIAKTPPPTITDKENSLIEQWKGEFRARNGNYEIKDRNYILIPLQLETDTNITLFSPFNKMNEFLSWADKKIPQEFNIIVRPHPLDDQLSSLDSFRNSERISIDSDTDLYKQIAECTAVLGINSTVLLESLIFDKPVFAIGEGIFQSSKAIEKHKLTQEFSTIKRTSQRQDSNALLSYLLGKQKPLPEVSNTVISRHIQPPLRTTHYNRLELLAAKTSIHLKQWLKGF